MALLLERLSICKYHANLSLMMPLFIPLILQVFCILSYLIGLVQALEKIVCVIVEHTVPHEIKVPYTLLLFSYVLLNFS